MSAIAVTFPGIRHFPQVRKGGEFELHEANSEDRGRTGLFRDRGPDPLCRCLDFPVAGACVTKSLCHLAVTQDLCHDWQGDVLHDSLTSMPVQSGIWPGTDHGHGTPCVVRIWRVNLEVKRPPGAVDCPDRVWPGLSSGSIVEVRVAGRLPSSSLISESDLSLLARAA